MNMDSSQIRICLSEKYEDDNGDAPGDVYNRKEYTKTE